MPSMVSTRHRRLEDATAATVTASPEPILDASAPSASGVFLAQLHSVPLAEHPTVPHGPLTELALTLERHAGRAAGFRGARPLSELSGPEREFFPLTLSLWRSYADLWHYVHTSRSDTARWYERTGIPLAPSRVLWWTDTAEPPDPVTALDRLRRLRRSGPSPAAFTLRSPVPRPAGGSHVR